MLKILSKIFPLEFSQDPLFHKTQSTNLMDQAFTSRWMLVLVLAFIFACMLFLNLKTPLIADDYLYAVFDHRPLSSISEIISSMTKHYCEWGGRVLVHGVAQLFLMQNHVVFAVCNAVVFTFLVFIICVNAAIVSKLKLKWPLALLTFVFIASFSPRFGQDALWLIGSCNYLWSTTLILGLLLPFELCAIGKYRFEKSLFTGILIICLSFVAGWTTEGGGITFISSIALIIFFYFYRYRKIKWWMICSLFTATTGFLVMILAPGNYVRLASDNDGIQIVKGFLKVLGSYFDPEFLLYPLCMLLFLIQLPVFKETKVKVHMMMCTLILLASTFCFTISPSYTGRVQFLPACIAAVLILIPLSHLRIDNLFSKRLMSSASLLIFVMSCHMMFVAAHDTLHLNRSYKALIALIKEQSSNSTIQQFNNHFSL